LHHGTQASGIAVDIDGRDAERITLTITNGGTIPPNVMPHLFEAFGNPAADQHEVDSRTPVGRSADGRPRDGLGLGLGLHIVRTSVHMHGGKVYGTSDEERGTVFTIELPRTAYGTTR
jgi:signal transduction histidine kinase